MKRTSRQSPGGRSLARGKAPSTSQIIPRYLTLRGGATAYTGLSIRTLYNAVARGEFKVGKNGGRTVVERIELDRWLDRRVRPVKVERADE
jgi:Helix-turn-helix domain